MMDVKNYLGSRFQCLLKGAEYHGHVIQYGAVPDSYSVLVYKPEERKLRAYSVIIPVNQIQQLLADPGSILESYFRKAS